MGRGGAFAVFGARVGSEQDYFLSALAPLQSGCVYAGETGPAESREPEPGVGSSISSPTLFHRGSVERMGRVGPLLQELRAGPSPAQPQLSKFVGGHVSRELPGGTEVREVPLPR